MLLLPLHSIQVAPNRQRREFDEQKLQELSTSIATNGLLQPIVVRALGSDAYQLVAGERRLRAIANLHFLGKAVRYAGGVDAADQAVLISLPQDTIPCLSLGDLDALAAEEAELDENIKRVDLSWQERASAVSRLAALRAKQATAAGTSVPRVAAIALEVRGSADGVHHETTRRELIVAQHLDKPEVAAAKTVDEAFKVLKRQEEVKKNVELAATVGKTFTSAVHEVHNTDSIAWMKAQPAGLFDVVLTDPPYGMGADRFGDSGGMAAGKHFYDDSYETWIKLMPAFAQETARITKAQAHLYAFCDFDRFHALKSYLEVEGWNCFRTPLVWVKPSASRLPWVDFGPQRKYELILYANKGRKPVTKIFPDVVSYNPDDNMGHNAQKPVALFVDLLKRSVAPGDTVLDPFAGSGPILEAAHELKCKAVAVELDPNPYAMCLKRLDRIKAQQELPLSGGITSLAGLK